MYIEELLEIIENNFVSTGVSFQIDVKLIEQLLDVEELDLGLKTEIGNRFHDLEYACIWGDDIVVAISFSILNSLVNLTHTLQNIVEAPVEEDEVHEITTEETIG